MQRQKEPSIGFASTAAKPTNYTTACGHGEFMEELQEEQAWSNLLMGNVEDLESDKHVRQTEPTQKVFSLVLPRGDTSAMNNSRDCVGCHYLCIHQHISSESLALTCLVISWLQR